MDDDFVTLIRNSRSLTAEQKELLLEDPDRFSEEYRQTIMETVRAYDVRSMKRERELRVRLEEAYRTLESSLYETGADPETRKEILANARAQINGFFPK